MSYYNPFNDLYQHESNKHIHARTLRTSLKEKMKDTFFIFSGTGLFNEFRDKDIHVGLFDYATLGIPLLVDYTFIKLTRNNASLPTRLVLWLLLLITNAVRFTLAAAFTAVASPFVLATHAISSWASSSHKERVNKLPLTLLFGGRAFGKSTLGLLLADEGLSLDDIEVHYVAAGKSNAMPEQHFVIRGKNNESISRDYSSYISMNERFINENKASLDAMLELNVGHFSALFNSIPDKTFKDQFPDEIDENSNGLNL